MPSFHVRNLIAAILFSITATAQKPQAPEPPISAPNQLSPKATYDGAMHPLEVTRHSIANWSDTEKQALQVTIKQAATECIARDPKSFTGDALIDLARLCALGQSWPAVVQTTALYISADTPAKPLLNQAYAMQIDAQLRLKDEKSALAGAQAMLGAVPYDTLVAEVVDEAIEYMQFLYTADALTLDAARQPLLLDEIRHTLFLSVMKMKAAENGQADPALATPPQSLHELYTDGLAYAALQQLANQPEAAATTVKLLDAEIPRTPVPDDAIPIASARKRYAFLGKPLPPISLLDSLSMPNKLPELPAHGAMTALLLFPDWCAQCIALGPGLPQSVFLIEGREAYLYALLAETLPSRPKRPPVRDGPTAKDGPPAKDLPPEKPTPREMLAETPTVVVPPAVLTQFAAEDFPFLIIADAHGIIRVIQPVDEDIVQPGGTLDSALAVVGRTWPIRPTEGTEPPKPATTSKP